MWVHRILKEERDIVISSRALEATGFQVENIRIAYVFYENGLSINVMYTVDDPKKRAVGFGGSRSTRHSDSCLGLFICVLERSDSLPAEEARDNEPSDRVRPPPAQLALREKPTERDCR